MSENKPMHFDGSIHSMEAAEEVELFELTPEGRKNITGNPFEGHK
ncbi:hypothetical protein [Falsibacillus pallidus]